MIYLFNKNIYWGGRGGNYHSLRKSLFIEEMVRTIRLLFLFTLRKVGCIYRMTTLIISFSMRCLWSQLQLTKRALQMEATREVIFT